MKNLSSALLLTAILSTYSVHGQSNPDLSIKTEVIPSDIDSSMEKHDLPKIEKESDKISAPVNEEKELSPNHAGKESKSPAPQTSKEAPSTVKKNGAYVAKKFIPFTGKITKNKVRVRLEPNFEGTVLRELKANDLIVILGETEDFYAVQPPQDFKAYVFRTFVLDNVIEGNKVNVRLKPDLDSPVVVQLNSGDRVEGNIYPSNNKWLEIKLPEASRFFVAKEYVEKAGDVNLKGRLDKKREEVNHVLNTTDALSKAEMLKPFEQINLDRIKADYQKIIENYPEFPDAVQKAKEQLTTLLEAFTVKKLTYLENQTKSSSATVETNKKLAAELEAQKTKVSALEQQIQKTRQQPSSVESVVVEAKKPSELPVNMTIWAPVENRLFEEWSKKTGSNNLTEFYQEQKQEGFVLKGIIDTYSRPVKNKPGDFMLLNSSSKLPIAFLYSTNINLQDYVGHEVSIVVTPRDNNSFAFPAYFVLGIE